MTQGSDARIETYMNRLETALRGVSPEYKNDILREIRAHIMDSAEHSEDHAGAVDRVLRLLGTPEDLATRYSTECQLDRASRSFSPWLILKTCWQWAKLGVKGTLAFFVALFGYAFALGFTVSVFLKLFIPKIGYWSGPEGFGIIVPTHPELMHEWLGNYFIPVIAAAAFLSAIGTTQLLRWMMRKREPGLAVPADGQLPVAHPYFSPHALQLIQHEHPILPHLEANPSPAIQRGIPEFTRKAQRIANDEGIIGGLHLVGLVADVVHWPIELEFSFACGRHGGEGTRDQLLRSDPGAVQIMLGSGPGRIGHLRHSRRHETRRRLASLSFRTCRTKRGTKRHRGQQGQ